MLYSLPLLFGNCHDGQVDDDYDHCNDVHDGQDDVHDELYDDVNDERPSLLFCLLSLLASYCHGTNYLIKVIIKTTIFIIIVMIMNIIMISKP